MPENRSPDLLICCRRRFGYHARRIHAKVGRTFLGGPIPFRQERGNGFSFLTAMDLSLQSCRNRSLRVFRLHTTPIALETGSHST